jgi:hypothetical protein
MHRPFQSVLTASLFLSVSAWGQNNPCDLTNDGRVDGTDVQAAINMSLGLSSCTANVYGSGVCNVVVVQRVINASLGGTCLTGSGIAHSVSLTWTASTSPNVTAYKVYRGAVSGGPYSLVSSLGATTSFTDNNVASGQTYYYVVTASDSSSESSYSNQAQAVVPVP